MGYIFHETEDEFHITTEYDHRLTTVDIVDHRTGIHARGNAKVAPEDSFNLEIGQKLAYLRANQRYLKKLEKKVVREPELVYDLVSIA